MIELVKQRKIVIIVIILAIILIGWKIYDSSSYTTIESEENTSAKNINNDIKNENDEEIILIHIIGEVKEPGVVEVKEGSRIKDIIEAAGGLTENADISNVNLAFVVEDGMKIKIPNINEEELEEEYITQSSGKGVIMSEESKESSIIFVNINTASQTELEKLPGIGPSIATKIVEYRAQNGKFKDIEDIKNVTGIGDSKFAKIKDFIKIK